MKTTTSLLTFLSFFLFLNHSLLSQTQIGNDLIGENPEDEFGFRIELSGDGNRLIIGAPANNGNGNFSGEVQVYERNGNNWDQLGQDINGTAGSELGYNVAISSDGNIIAAGTPIDDTGGSQAGIVRIYQLNGNNWEQLGNAITGQTNDRLGSALELSEDGSRVAVGGSSTLGVMKIFELNGGNWNQLGSDIVGDQTGAFYGYYMDMNAAGDRVVMGIPTYEVGGQDAGQVRAYEYNDTNWVQMGSFIDAPQVSAVFGDDVSMSASGLRIAVAAPGLSSNGALLTYEFNGTDWNQYGSTISGASGYQIGTGVTLSANGNIIAGGANDFPDDRGQVCLFTLSGNSWVQAGNCFNGHTN